MDDMGFPRHLWMVIQQTINIVGKLQYYYWVYGLLYHITFLISSQYFL